MTAKKGKRILVLTTYGDDLVPNAYLIDIAQQYITMLGTHDYIRQIIEGGTE